MAAYSVISADSHLEISTERWIGRVPEEHRDRAPRRVSLPNGGDAWLVEGEDLRVCGMELCGKPYEEYEPTGVTYEGSAGTGSPEQRVAEQDRDGIDAEILFTGVGGPTFWRAIRNDASYLAVVRAYNEFLAHEYCAAAPDRLVGMGVIPEVDLECALAELRYCANAGLKGVVMNAFPSGKMHPTDADDVFYKTAIDLGIALTVHVAFRFGVKGERSRTWVYPKSPPDVSPGARDPIKRFASWAMSGGFNAVQLTMCGVFERIPELRMYFAENQLGWIPHFLEQFDMLYDRNIHWARRHFGVQAIDRRPSEWVRERCYWGFLNNPFGVRVRHEIGVDRVMWANDFPHSDSDWPRSQEVIKELMDGVPEPEQHRMLCGNAMDYFNLASV